MLFFSRKYELLETPFFEGFKDFHNHALPAVDDGVSTLEESLAALSYFERLGVSQVVLTPHAMVGVNETDDAVNAAYARLVASYDGPISLSLASEYMLDSNFLKHLDRGARLIEESNILVETSYFSAPRNMYEMLFDISAKGINPVIAHVERYQYMSREEYHLFIEREYSLQLNLLSFSGLYGSRVVENAIYLLESGAYSVVGTDLHSLERFKYQISKIKLSKKHIDMLLAIKERGL